MEEERTHSDSAAVTGRRVDRNAFFKKTDAKSRCIQSLILNEQGNQGWWENKKSWGMLCESTRIHRHTHTQILIHTLGSKAAETMLKICTSFKYCIYRNKHTSLFVSHLASKYSSDHQKHKQIKATIKHIWWLYWSDWTRGMFHILGMCGSSSKTILAALHDLAYWLKTGYFTLSLDFLQTMD